MCIITGNRIERQGEGKKVIGLIKEGDDFIRPPLIGVRYFSRSSVAGDP
jgi:hypothetical protein